MLKKLTHILLGMCCMISIASAGGSNYSIFGIGDIREDVGAGYAGMAGTALAVPSAYAINLMNPSASSYNLTTRLQVGFQMQQYQVKTSERSISQNNGEADGINMVFAIDTAAGIGAQFGIRPYSTVNYLFRLRGPVEGEFSSDTAQTTYDGSGGMSSLYLGASFRPIPDLSVGAEIMHYLGSIRSRSFTEVEVANARDIEFSDVRGFKGTGMRFGLMYRGIEKLTIGATAEFNGNVGVDESFVFPGIVNSGGVILSPDSTVSSYSSIVLPFTLGLGISYRTGEFLWAADWVSRDFTDFTYRTSEVASVTFRNSNRYSLGMQWFGALDPSRATLEGAIISAGLGYNEQYYVVNGQEINELFASIGAQFPLTSRVNADIGISGGMRGTTDNGLFQDSFLKFSFAVSVGDTWFIPFDRK